MDIKKLQPGMTVYDVGRIKMGNTTMSTVSVWSVRIVSVDLGGERVVASWNGNAPKEFSANSVKRWRAKKPVLIKTGWAYRLATREEL